MTDVVFFLKSAPSKLDKNLSWPKDTLLVAIDPPAVCRCGGSDPRCSSAYSCLWQSLKDAQGRVLPSLLKKYAPGVKLERIAFVGFSAAHGLLNPLTNNDTDRAGISALILMDATFGGGKIGYQKFARDAMSGRKLLVTATSNTGGDEAWRSSVWVPVGGSSASKVSAKSPVPQPSGGAYQLGDLHYLRYVNSTGGTELPHWEMGKIQNQILSAYLVPFFRGNSDVKKSGIFSIPWAPIGIAAAAAFVWWRLR